MECAVGRKGRRIATGFLHKNVGIFLKKMGTKSEFRLLWLRISCGLFDGSN
jgi:hypothetical protein